MTETEESSEASALKHRVAFVFLAAVLLLVLYVLSIGPVGWLMDKTGGFGKSVPSEVFQTFYSPLIWVHEHNDFARKNLNAYVGLFGIK